MQIGCEGEYKWSLSKQDHYQASFRHKRCLLSASNHWMNTPNMCLLSLLMLTLFGSIIPKKWISAILWKYPPVLTDLHVFLKTLSGGRLISGYEILDPWSHLFHYQQVQVSLVQCLCKTKHTTNKTMVNHHY